MVDEAAVAELYERHGYALYRRCLSLLGHDADAHEVLQEVFCQFWQGRGRFEGRSSPFTFLYRIATNLCIDRLRRRRTRGTQYSWDHGEPLLQDGNHESSDAQISAAEQLAVLTADLDADSLMVAVMSYVDGMTQEEIAAALGLSRRTIGKRLKKFLQHTRDRLEMPSLEQKRAHG